MRRREDRIFVARYPQSTRSRRCLPLCHCTCVAHVPCTWDGKRQTTTMNVGGKRVGRAALFAVLICRCVSRRKGRKSGVRVRSHERSVWNVNVWREKVAHVGAARARLTFRVRPLSTRPDLNASDVQFPIDNRARSR